MISDPLHLEQSDGPFKKMICQLCNDVDGPWEFADVINTENGHIKTMLICENCADMIRKEVKK